MIALFSLIASEAWLQLTCMYSFYSRYFKFFFMTRWVLHGSSSPSCVSLYHSRMAKQLVISCSCPICLLYRICLNQHCRHFLLYQHCRSPHCQPCQPLNHHCLSLHCLHFPACQQCLLSPRSPCLHFQACLQSPPSQQQFPPSPSSPHLPEIRPTLVFLFWMFDYSAYCIDLYEVAWGIYSFISVFFFFHLVEDCCCFQISLYLSVSLHHVLLPVLNRFTYFLSTLITSHSYFLVEQVTPYYHNKSFRLVEEMKLAIWTKLMWIRYNRCLNLLDYELQYKVFM